MSETMPTLPTGYSWQLIDYSGTDCTDVPLYAVTDAVEARVWTENGDLVQSVIREEPGALWIDDADTTYADLAAVVAALREIDALDDTAIPKMTIGSLILDDSEDDFEVVCDNGCPEGARGRHKFSCPLAAGRTPQEN